MGLLSVIGTVFFGCAPKSPFHKKGDSWYWKDESTGVPASVALRPLNDQFAIAGAAAYFRSSVVTTTEGGSFQALDHEYAKDAAHVYFCDDYRDGKEYFLIRHHRVTTIHGADATTFRLLGHGYARDTNTVYHAGRRFTVSDLASYERIDETFARDTVRGYFGTTAVPNSDGRSFVPVDPHYSKDRAHVFYSRVVTDSSAPTGEVRTVQLEGADPASFVALDDAYGTDGTRVYYRGKPLVGVTTPLEVLQFGYAKSGPLVYYEGVILEGADAATFTVRVATVEPSDAADAQHVWFNGRRVVATPP